MHFQDVDEIFESVKHAIVSSYVDMDRKGGHYILNTIYFTLDTFILYTRGFHTKAFFQSIKFHSST